MGASDGSHSKITINVGFYSVVGDPYIFSKDGYLVNPMIFQSNQGLSRPTTTIFCDAGLRPCILIQPHFRRHKRIAPRQHTGGFAGRVGQTPTDFQTESEKSVPSLSISDKPIVLGRKKGVSFCVVKQTMMSLAGRTLARAVCQATASAEKVLVSENE
jgi:hypothetical protein